MELKYFLMAVFLLIFFIFLLSFIIFKIKFKFYEIFSVILLVFGGGGTALLSLEIALNLKFFDVKKESEPEIPYFISHKAYALRFIEDTILFVLTPNKTLRTFGHKFSTNKWGFREKNFSSKKNQNTFRILVFGDSFTFGEGIDDDHRYTNLLEEMLALKFPKKNTKF
jgi:hypothetical protein